MTMLEKRPEMPVGPLWVSRFLVPEMWATLSISIMWLAVLFVGVYGSDMVFSDSANGTTTIPSSVAVALFAAIGTSSVAKRLFGGIQRT